MADINEQRHDSRRLGDYLRILRERSWIVILCAAATFLVALLVSITTTPLYTASAVIVYVTKTTSTPVFGYEVLGYDYDRPRSIETAIAAVKMNDAISAAVQKELQSGGSPAAERSPGSLAGMVSASSSADTDLVSITAVSTDPEEAALVANAFASQFIAYRKTTSRALAAEAANLVEATLRSMTTAQLESGYGRQQQEKYDALRLLEATHPGDFTLMSEAAVPGVPFTPRTKRNVVLALVVGLALGVGLAFLLEHLDRRIKDERTLEQVAGLPVLTTVPIVGRAWRRPKDSSRSPGAVGFAGDRSPLLESFRTLRSTLQYFNLDTGLHTLLVTSGLPQEGKTVTTVNLGISLALSGKRTVVLEADLRRPMVHEYLRLQNDIGLSSILAGNSSVPGALQQVTMDPFIPARSRRSEDGSPQSLVGKNLYCITSGPLPPNPAELLQSARMSDIISELEHMADYLLIDTPPVLPVSDVLVLAPSVDAVILTARLRSTTRDEIEQVTEALHRTGVHVIGVVAGGAKTGRSYYYKRGYRYGGYSYQ